MTNVNDIQHGGTHYEGKAIQPWDYIASNNIGFLDGNAIKYLSRWRERGGIEDLKKAEHYIDKLIEIEQALPMVEQAPPTVEPPTLEQLAWAREAMCAQREGKPTPDGTAQPVHKDCEEICTLRRLNIGLQKELDQMKKELAYKHAIYEFEMAHLKKVHSLFRP